MGQSTLVPDRQLPGMSVVVARSPLKVETHLMTTCESLLDAIHLCVHMGRLPHQAVCSRLGIDKGHWARIMTGQAHFPTNKIGLLMEVCGNYAPLQWLAGNAGFELYEDAQAKREAELERELEAIRSRRAA